MATPLTLSGGHNFNTETLSVKGVATPLTLSVLSIEIMWKLYQDTGDALNCGSPSCG